MNHTHISTPKNIPTLTYKKDTRALKGENKYMERDRKVIHNTAEKREISSRMFQK